MKAPHNSSGFYKNEKRKVTPEEEKKPHLSEMFESNDSSSISSNSHKGHHSADELVRRFSASVGSNSLHRSVAEFYLEMCSQNVEWAVTFFKEQQGVDKQSLQEVHNDIRVPRKQDYHQYDGKVPASLAVAAVAPRRITPRRLKSQNTDTAVAPRPRVQTPRRHKSRDAAEAATVTAPSVHRSNHSRYYGRRRATGDSTPTMARRCTIAVASSDANLFRGPRSRAGVPLLRSTSERRVAATHGNVATLCSSTYHFPKPRRSSDPLVVRPKQSSRDTGYYPNDAAAITRPHTALSSRMTMPRRKGANLYQALSAPTIDASWEPPSRQALAASNPAA